MKKILSIILAVALMFGAVPMSGTFKNILGVEAEALETVAGSYDYLVNYINANGSKDSDGDLGIEYYYTCKTKTSSSFNLIRIEYDKSEGYLIFSEATKMDGYEGNDVVSMVVTKTGNTYLTLVSIYTSNNSHDSIYTYIDPSTYNNGSLSYSYKNITYTNSSYKATLCDYADVLIEGAMMDFDNYLTETVGFGIGNFGFSKIAKTASVPASDTPAIGFFEAIIDVFINIYNFFSQLYLFLAIWGII